MPIPTPELVEDALTGALLYLEEYIVLAVGTLPADLPAASIFRPAQPLIIRYGIAYLQREAAIVPGLFASEYGALLLGREAWDYAHQHANLHPRADLVGLNTDGEQDQVMLRALDFGRPVSVLAYDSAAATLPLAKLAGYWAGPDASPLPDLLIAHLPRREHLTPPPD